MTDKLPQILDTCAIPDFNLVHVDVKLATVFGLNEAIVLDRISKICAVSDVIHDGHQWAPIVASNPNYYHLDFLSPSGLRRTLTSLRIKKVVVSAKLDEDPMVQVNSYRIIQTTLDHIMDSWDGSSKDYKGDARHISHELKYKILNRDGGVCQNCGDIEDLSIDHKLPVSRGGVSHEHNLQILCMSCNSSKGTKTMAEWLRGNK